jgi:hypothetical protein
MSDPRHLDPLRRLNLQARPARTATIRTVAARTATAAMWTTLWTWLAALAAAAVVLGLVFGYSRTDLAHNQSSEPATTGSATTGSAAAPLSLPRPGDARAPAPENQ